MRSLLFALFCAMQAAGQVTVFPLNAALKTTRVAPGTLVQLFWFSEGKTISPIVASAKVRPASYAQAVPLPILSGDNPLIVALPSDLPAGAAQVTLTLNGVASSPAILNIVPAAFGVFTVSSYGTGPAAAQNNHPGEQTSANQLTNPATAGEYVTLWGTGLGEATAADLRLELYGRPVEATYAGHSTYAGVDQINFVVPADVPDGCYLSMTISAFGTVSNEFTLSKGPAGGACTHPLGLSKAQLKSLDAGGKVLYGIFGVNSGVAIPGGSTGYTRSEYAFGSAIPRDAFGVFSIAGPEQPDSRLYSCSLTYSPIYASIVEAFPSGGTLIFTGPAGQHLDIRGVNGEYYGFLASPPAVDAFESLRAPFFSPGAWQVAASGDNSIDPFQRTFNLPPPVRIANRDALAAIDRSAGLTVSWDATGYSASDVMSAELYAGSSFSAVCRAPASAGKMTMPSSILLQIAAAKSGRFSLQLTPHPRQRVEFLLPPAVGGPIPAQFSYAYSDTRIVSVN